MLLFSQSVEPESCQRRDLRDVPCLPGILGIRTPSLSFTAQTLHSTHYPPENQIRKASVLVSILMSRSEKLHDTINTSVVWGKTQEQMLKFECPIKAISQAGEEWGRAGLGRPRNVKTNMSKWDRVCKERREGGQLRKPIKSRNS